MGTDFASPKRAELYSKLEKARKALWDAEAVAQKARFKTMPKKIRSVQNRVLDLQAVLKK